LAEGSVYPALHRLEWAGMLEGEWADEAGRRRRTYRLTAKGGRVLAQRADDWRRFTRGMTAALGGVG
jgi:PadR family transcriptional regulator PadR